MTPYYEDDLVTLYHGDCWGGMASLPDDSIDLILTDPPYNVTENNGRDGTTVGKVKRSDGSYREVVRNFGEWDRGFDPANLTVEAMRLLVHRGGFIAFTSDILLGAYMATPLHHMRTLVWMKSNPAPQFPGNYQSACEWLVWQGKGGPPIFNGGGAVSNVYVAPIPANKRHPNEKPIDLVKRLVLAHSLPGQLILDPFAGSGTTLQAAADTGRRAIGFEANERHCETAAKRLAQQAFDFGVIA
jgi:DNA modification methylase